MILRARGCEIGRDRASQSHSLSQRGSYSGRGGEQRWCSIQPVEGATKVPSFPVGNISLFPEFFSGIF